MEYFPGNDIVRRSAEALAEGTTVRLLLTGRDDSVEIRKIEADGAFARIEVGTNKTWLVRLDQLSGIILDVPLKMEGLTYNAEDDRYE